MFGWGPNRLVGGGGAWPPPAPIVAAALDSVLFESAALIFGSKFFTTIRGAVLFEKIWIHFDSHSKQLNSTKLLLIIFRDIVMQTNYLRKITM